MNMNMQEQLKQLQSNPREFIQRAGLNVPEEMLNNPKQMVMHLINTNQVGGGIRGTVSGRAGPHGTAAQDRDGSDRRIQEHARGTDGRHDGTVQLHARAGR